MSFTGVLDGWVALIGGVSGLIFLVYIIGMLYFANKRRRDIEELRREIERFKGMLSVHILQQEANRWTRRK